MQPVSGFLALSPASKHAASLRMQMASNVT